MGLPSSILITGAAGFVGARVVESCQDVGHRIISVDERAHFKERGEHCNLDFQTIVDRSDLFDFLQTAPRPRAIIHLGALTDTTDLDETRHLKMNFEYSRRLWEEATRLQVPFVFASSAAIYGDGTSGYEDNDSLVDKYTPLNPYGDSKLLFDKFALGSAAAGQAPPSWSGFRFFNVYGYGEAHKGKMASVVLQAFQQIRETGKVRLFKSDKPEFAHGEQKRDFIYVEDVVKVLWFAVEKPIRNGILNLGTGKARTFNDLVTSVFRAMKREPKIEYFDMPSAIAERYQYFTEAPMTRLHKEGFRLPFTSIEEGISEYIDRLLEVAR